MAELGFVLAVAAVNGATAAILARGEVPRAGVTSRAWLGLAAVGLGLSILGFGGVFAPELRARALLAIGGLVFGLGAALISAEARERALAVVSLRASASSAIVPLTIAGASAVALMMMSLRAPGAVSPLMFAFALGASLGTLLGSRAGDPFPIIAVATATATASCALVAARNVVAFRAVGFHGSTLVALGPLLPLLSAMALAIGALAVRADEGEADETPVLRGFAVATLVGTLAVIAAGHWWARPPGRGGWLTLPALAAAMGSLVVLLLGRYYDDPTHRAGRAIARARRSGPKTRRRVGARIGAEGALLVIVVAAAVGLAASRGAEMLGLEAAGALGLAIAIAGCLTSFAYLDAVAGGREGRTLAHDVMLVALCGVASLGRPSVALAAVPIVATLVSASVLERMAAASEGDPETEELRRGAALLPVVASGILAAAATLGAVFGEG